MKNKFSYKFLVGLLFGVMAGFVVWYWQKSTSAEEGALALLDRLASAENKLRKLGEERFRAFEAGPRQSASAPVERAAEVVPADDMQQVRGIGPVFADRLRQAGIVTVRQLAATGQGQLVQILGTNEQRAEAILEAAQQIDA